MSTRKTGPQMSPVHRKSSRWIVPAVLVLAALGWGAVRADPPGEARRAVASIHDFGRRLAEPSAWRTRADSPLTLYRALALLWAGARNETAAEIAAVLGDPGGAVLWADLESLERQLSSSTGGAAPVLRSERLWLQDAFPIQSGFLDFARRQGVAEPGRLDFRAEPEAARRRINAAIREATGERIPELFPAGSITDQTRMVLACTAFFHGRWQEAFDRRSTRRERFRGLAGAPRVPMMNRTGNMEYAGLDGWQQVVLPFDDGQTALAVLLPPPGTDLAQAATRLPEMEPGLQARRQARTVELALPRFAVESSANLAFRLVELGMPRAFSPKQADFSGISPDVYLFGIYQSVGVKVDEAGATAAAAAGAVMAEKGMPAHPEPPVVFRADRPFFFRIFDLQTGLAWFSGCVADLPDSVPAGRN
jgi:serpin B